MQQRTDNIQQISPNCFVGKGYAKSGEEIFLTMELITEDNQKHIKQFVESAKDLTNGSRGLLTILPYKIKYNGEKYVLNCNQGLLEQIKESTGFTDRELEDFVDYMGRQGFHSENARKETSLSETGHGANHLYAHVGEQRYFVYVSKDPNFRIQNTKLKDVAKLTLKEFISEYDNIIMCVGSDFSLEGKMHNRGIFRNPMPAIANEYKGISMTLHSMIGTVGEAFFNKQEMVVRPVGIMSYLIFSSVTEADVIVKQSLNDTDAKMTYQQALQASKKLESFEHCWVCVKTEALSRIFGKSQIMPQEKIEAENNSCIEKINQQLNELKPYKAKHDSLLVKAGIIETTDSQIKALKVLRTIISKRTAKNKDSQELTQQFMQWKTQYATEIKLETNKVKGFFSSKELSSVEMLVNDIFSSLKIGSLPANSSSRP